VDILIMEYLGCGTLEARITQGDKSIPVPRARLYWNQLARAVEFLHEQRVIHRDIKPPNVIFKSEDHLKLCDFGISKKLKSSDEVTGTQLGSPHYAAPEILNGEAYAFPSDIWSLGITVLDMFRLSPPKLESWRIAGPAGSASDRWLSAVEGAVRALPYDLGLLRGQLEKEQNLRPTAASLVAGLKEQPLSQARSSSAAVDEVGKLSKRILDPIPVEGRKKSHAAGA
jgi:serine/threonine protein kinase